MKTQKVQCRSTRKDGGNVYRCTRNRHKSGWHRVRMIFTTPPGQGQDHFFAEEVELRWKDE